MCGRLACSLSKDELSCACSYVEKKAGQTDQLIQPVWLDCQDEYQVNYNLPPSCTVPAIVSSHHFRHCSASLTEKVLVPMRFGMLVDTSQKNSLHTHNCRLDNLMDSRLYSPRFRQGFRCAVVCSGYFEWQVSTKQPYLVHSKQTSTGQSLLECKNEFRPLYLAAIFAEAEKEGEAVFSCSVLTTEADNTLSWLHDRQPLILESDQQLDLWINPGVAFAKSLEALQPPQQLAWYKVDRRALANTKTGSKACIENLDNSSSNKFFKGWLETK